MTNKTALLIEVERGAEFPESISDLFKFEFIQKIYLRDVTSEFNANIFDFILYFFANIIDVRGKGHHQINNIF